MRNTNLPKSNALLVIFEAVINSIHSIDERIQKYDSVEIDDTYIKVRVLHSPQLLLSNSEKPEVIGFEILDNGIGFTKENFHSFKTLDSEYKIGKGCRGVGRLLWLKAFKNSLFKRMSG